MTRRPLGIGRYYVDAEGGFWRLSSRGAFRSVAVWDRVAGHGRGVYPSVTLWVEGKKRNYYAHVLVACAFPETCGTEFEGAIVRHLDGDASNFRPENLRFGTVAENEADKVWHAENGRGTIREDSVRGYAPDDEFGF